MLTLLYFTLQSVDEILNCSIFNWGEGGGALENERRGGEFVVGSGAILSKKILKCRGSEVVNYRRKIKQVRFKHYFSLANTYVLLWLVSMNQINVNGSSLLFSLKCYVIRALP